jgi:hypothetical protein
MKMAFFKTENIRDVLIACFTFGPYSHSEFLFSNGECFSATPVGNAGVRLAPAASVLTDLSKWDFLELPINAEQESNLRTWCNGEVGCPYDWNDVFRFILKFLPEDPNAWFCSEICLAGLQQVGMFKSRRPCNYSPNRFYRLLVGSGLKPVVYSP